MKLSRIALAMLVAAPFAAANAGVTITPLMLGYHWYPENTQDKMRDTLTDRDPQGRGGAGSQKNGVALQSDLLVGGAIGVELTPWLQAEVEYQQTNADAARNEKTHVNGQPWDAKQQTLSLNAIATADALTGNYASKLKPYVLLGGGYSKITVDNPGWDRRTYDTIGNVGLGAFWELNDALSLRAEGRAVHNFDNNWWEAQAFAALQVVVGGHLRPAAPVVDVEPVETAPVVQPAPEPQEVTEDLNMELRVFFDTNKSDIKPQYKAEIGKVAEKLSEYPNATARIEGHTDNTGPRQLNERLSLARANSVKSALVNDYNVDASRLTTEGFAWDQPIADNSTKEGRAMNRRVFATITGSRTVLQQPEEQQEQAQPQEQDQQAQ